MGRIPIREKREGGNAGARGKLELPERARLARVKKILCKDWGIKPWELDKLTAKDLQDVWLAEHTEAYIEQQKREETENPDSISHNEYDVAESRAKAFQ